MTIDRNHHDHRRDHNKEITIKDFEHDDDCPCCRHVGRRSFIGALTLSAAGLLLQPQFAQAATRRERLIKMYNPHTGETLRTVFWTPDYGYIQPAIEQISWFFRDFRRNQKKNIDIDLLNILHYIQNNVGQNRTMSLHSGYRSPQTNAMLARRSKNVGKNSYHMQAKAADISIKGFNSRDLRMMAKKINAGGVGIYRGSSFIHVDSGPVREWHY